MLFVRRLTAGLAVWRTSQPAAGRRTLYWCCTGADCAAVSTAVVCNCPRSCCAVLAQDSLWPGPVTVAQLAVIQQRGHCRSYIYSLVGSSMIRAARRSGAHPVIIGKNEPLVKIDCR